ncbi:hypothetical protein RHMOL_Rhmol03G0009100 [Rhododendron molle]|uniref:Uncharacterized protein n=1 Tax=Rhododendron molle TaxID=49168 RepID=A0ACC0PA80_RHOML|nr:hypothetical protein RHMOL_Rhmol03G0009100 [Rhododendron molle]
MNTDREFSLLNGESGGGVVFRGCSAHILKALSIKFGKLCSPRSAEFETLRVGLTEAIKLKYLTPILKIDCLPSHCTGKVCWDIYIDGLVVSSDGNVLDALGVAIKAALSNTGIPKVHVAASASSDGQPEVDVSDEEFLQFDTSRVLVVVTLTKAITRPFFHKWVGRHYIVDATSQEESQMSSAISVSINRQGRICGLTKRRGAGLDPSIILDMISVAKHVSEQLMNKLDSEIYAAEACEEES